MAGGSPPKAGSRSLIKIFSNIFISFIGAGLLGLPYAFKESGVMEGVLIMVFVGVVSTKAMLLIIDCKYKIVGSAPYQRVMNGRTKAEEAGEMEELPDVGYISYGDIGYAALGRLGRSMVEISIVISQIGFTCAYLIFIIHNLGSYLPDVADWHFMAVLLPLIYTLTLFRRLASLGYFSLFAQLSNLFAFMVVLWFDFAHLSHAKLNPREFNIYGLPFFAAVAIYCYEGAGMILSLEASVHETRRIFFKKYFIITMCVVTSMYVAFGVCGYLSFGENTNPIITLNLPRGQSLNFALIVKVCLCMALLITYPVMMFPVTQILESLFGWHDAFWRGNLLRLALVLLGGVIVLMIPNFANLMALIGAGCCTLIAFILPGVFHILLFGRKQRLCGRLFDIFLILIGFVAMVIGLLDAFSRLQEESPKHSVAPLNDTVVAAMAPTPKTIKLSDLSPQLRRVLDMFADPRPTS